MLAAERSSETEALHASREHVWRLTGRALTGDSHVYRELRCAVCGTRRVVLGELVESQKTAAERMREARARYLEGLARLEATWRKHVALMAKWDEIPGLSAPGVAR
jgi:hypothetical protein